jgi:hypothetical protein
MSMRRWIGPALALALLALGACSGQEGKEGVPTANGGGAAPSASAPAGGDAMAYAQCIRDNGVPGFPDPEPDGRFNPGAVQGLDRGALADALEACQNLAPAGLAQATGKMTADQVDKWTRFAGCMRQAGIDLPDPDPNGSLLDWARKWALGRGGGDSGFQERSRVCQQQAGINLGGTS